MRTPLPHLGQYELNLGRVDCALDLDDTALTPLADAA